MISLNTTTPANNFKANNKNFKNKPANNINCTSCGEPEKVHVNSKLNILA